ncbi:MAG TPA: hypothetical protein VHO06_16720 [Polyangia bacterium]|nr:hypothetical protein [Polyangia bacterium]
MRKLKCRGRTIGAAAAALVVVGAVAATRPAHAEEVKPSSSAPGELTIDPAFGLDPATPQIAALPGGVTPAYGQRSLSEDEWRFDFHGLITAPLNMGIAHRQPNTVIAPGQSDLVLHAPPVVPDDLATFSHTGVTPTTYAQLNFSEGNSVVSANVSIVARQANVSESFLEPADQLGITDVYLNFLPPLPDRRFRLQVLAGAFPTRYGSAGEYDQGRYGTPLIAQINGVGELATLRYAASSDWVFMAEEGLHGQTNKAQSSITPDVWNNFADPGTGSTFVAHAHLGAGYQRKVTVGAHFIRAFSLDDRDGLNAPDGRINIFAGDVRLGLGRFGHFYAAYSYTSALQARALSSVISVLNTQGGPGLMQEYLGPNSNGTGSLQTVGGQYDLSLGKLVSYPTPFSGDGPDIVLSVFGMYTHVSSSDTTSVFDPYLNDPATGLPSQNTAWNGANKVKAGFEGTYSLLSWLAASLRYDWVNPFTKESDLGFQEISPRIIFHSDWQSTDQIVLQYTHWFYGSLTPVRMGEPPAYTMQSFLTVPDPDMLSISASMWW